MELGLKYATHMLKNLLSASLPGWSDMNRIRVISWNFTDASRTLEAVLSAGQEFIINRLKSLGISSYVVLETCNRMEVYYESENSLRIEGLPDPTSEYSREEAAKHLFRVSSGIESMSAGENEILGQVKDSFERSVEAGCVGKPLSLLFRKAISVGKACRERTGISRGKVSIPHFVVDTVEESFGINGKNVLVVGTGKMASDICKYVLGYFPGSITITGRNSASAKELANSLGVNVIPYDLVNQRAVASDIVMTATVAKEFIFTADRVRDIGGSRCYVDVSVPKNIDPSIAQLNGNILISTDSIIDQLNENRRRREAEIEKVTRIVDEELSNFLSKMSESRAEDFLSEVYNYSRAIESEEIEKFESAISAGRDPVEAASMMLRSALGKTLSPLTFAVKRMIREDGSKSVDEILDIMSREFIRDFLKYSGQTADLPGRRSPRSQIPQLSQKP
jgi:glutamyl-tRNA reductase